MSKLVMFSKLVSESLLFESFGDLNEFGFVEAEEPEERTGLLAAETLKLENDFFPISSPPLRFELTEKD